jgi:Dyp-type peroxidase family
MSIEDMFDEGVSRLTSMKPTKATAEELSDIQGGIIGFNKDHQRLVYLDFPDASSGRQFLGLIHPMLADARDVRDFNRAYSETVGDGMPTHDLQATWTNLWLSIEGLRMLDAPDLEAMPPAFTEGMAQRASLVGDAEVSAPSSWVLPFTGGKAPHVVVVIASDDGDPAKGDDSDLARGLADVMQIVTTTGATLLGDPQVGQTIAGNEGHEHFGFRDGISQPGIRGLTVSRNLPHDVIAAGEFLVGYEDEDGRVSGQSSSSPPVPTPSPYGGPPAPPPATPLPGWCRNGSFVVYRRLHQDVQGFRNTADQQAEADLTFEQLAAKLVGRWASGTPMEHVPGMPKSEDPSAEDLGTPAILKSHLNDFDYALDSDGLHVPRAAHIRKVNPRAANLPGGDASNRHRLIRRGIPYGPPFQDGESPYGGGGPDRGLLFVCYQADIADGFEFVQQAWANAPGFQQDGDGADPIVSQDRDPRQFRLPQSAGAKELQFATWVTTTGGGYFFAPSMSTIALLSGDTALA